MATPSIAMIPSAVKAGRVYSVLPTDGVGDFDFTRASTATRINSKGLIETVASGVPRLDYSNGDCPSLLLEPQSTNLINYSEDFSNAYWTKSNSSVVSGFASPDGGLNAFKLIESFSNSGHIIRSQNTNIVSGKTYSSFVFAKKGESNFLQLVMTGGFASIYVNFDLNTGIITESSNAIGTIKEVFNGYYKCTISAEAVTSTTATLFVIKIQNGSSSRFESYQGDGTSGLYIWGAQLEQNSYATSYIPTLTGTAQTRVAETCGGAGSSSYINSEEGVLYFEMSINTNLGVGSDITLIDSSNTANYIKLTNDGGANKVNMYFRYNGVSNFYTFIGDTTIFKKYAIQWGNGEVNYYVNGVLKETDSTTMPAIGVFDKVNFSNTGSSSRAFTGNTKDLRVYNTALSDEELIYLTGTLGEDYYDNYLEMSNNLNYTIQ